VLEVLDGYYPLLEEDETCLDGLNPVAAAAAGTWRSTYILNI